MTIYFQSQMIVWRAQTIEKYRKNDCLDDQRCLSTINCTTDSEARENTVIRWYSNWPWPEAGDMIDNGEFNGDETSGHLKAPADAVSNVRLLLAVVTGQSAQLI